MASYANINRGGVPASPIYQPPQQITYIDNRKTNLNVSITGIGSRSDIKIRYPKLNTESRKGGKEKSKLNLSQVITRANPFRNEKGSELLNKNDRPFNEKVSIQTAHNDGGV